MKKIKHLFEDSPFVNCFSKWQIDRLCTIFPRIRDDILGCDPLSGELEAIEHEIHLGIRLGNTDIKPKIDLFSKFGINRLQSLRRHGQSTLREVSKKGSNGLFTGFVSQGVHVEYDNKKQIWKIIGSSNYDHMFQLSHVMDIMIYDCLVGKWEYKRGQFTHGQTYVENLYPYLLMTSYLTPEENKKLPSILKKMKEECTDERTKFVDYRKFVDMLMNAEHYKRAGIVFHNELMNVDGKRVWKDIIPEEFRKLMGKKKVKKKKIQNKYW